MLSVFRQRSASGLNCCLSTVRNHVWSATVTSIVVLLCCSDSTNRLRKFGRMYSWLRFEMRGYVPKYVAFSTLRNCRFGPWRSLGRLSHQTYEILGRPARVEKRMAVWDNAPTTRRRKSKKGGVLKLPAKRTRSRESERQR